MVKLKAPLNYKGGIIPAGAVVSYLPKELEEKMVKSEAAEYVSGEKPASDNQDSDSDGQEELNGMKKDELLNHAGNLGLEVSEKMTKAEIIEVILAHQKAE